VGSSAGIELDWHKIQTGFTKIESHGFVRFDTEFTPSKRLAYISVVTADGTVVADALPRTQDLSVIITPDAQLIDSQYGDIWLGRNGKRYP